MVYGSLLEGLELVGVTLGLAFAIRVNFLTWVDTDNVHVARNNGVFVLDKPQQILEIGDATYEFQYTVSDQKTFAIKRADYLRDAMRQSLPPICDLPTPSKDDIFVGKW